MALIQSLLSRLRPAGVERVIYASDVVASVDGKGPDELFAEQPHLQTVIDFIAQNVAQLPLKCYIRRGDSDRERDTDGVLPRLLANPNPDMTAFDLVYSLVAEHSLYGRTIWVVGRDASSDSGWQIRPVPEAWVVGKTGSDGFGFKTLKFRDPDNAGGTVEIPTSQCVIFTRYRPGHPALALSPVESLKQTLTEQVEAQAFRRSVWQNGTLISGYISRPSGVEWGDGAAARFKKDMRANWTKGGAHAGGTPVLEDGMEFKSVDFNPRERDWASGVKLSREDCAAAYHVNPAIIWPGDGQTYASAKDNARALYADTLAPLLIMVQRRINKTLLPMIGAPANEYVEFDINAKLMGSFEEQASAFQSAVGAPWMTRQEARAKLNLPAEPDGEMVTPLNVLVGGLASPNDTAPKARYVMEPDAGPLARSGGCSCKACSSLTESGAVRGLRAKAHPSDEDVESYRSVLERFYEHQRKVVLSAMGAKSGRKADGAPAWWDAERWDRELAEDLHEAFVAGSTAAAKRALEQLGIDPGLYDEPRTGAYLKKLAEARARGINAKTLEQLEAAVSGEIGAGAEGSTPAGVFDKAASSRAAQQAQTIATAVAGWGALEAARQQAPARTLKTWVTNPSKQPRADHARMAGETVGVRERFSNGAQWPGDTSALSVDEVAYCHCEVELVVPDAEAGDANAREITSSTVTWGGRSFGKHANKHAAEFGFDVTTEAGREGYRNLADEIIDSPDKIGYMKWKGQGADECVFFFRDDAVVIVNPDSMKIVTLFKMEEDGNEQIARLRDSI